MKKSRINPISKKKRKQIEEEYPIRIQLCNRAGGLWHQTSRLGGYCSGGVCEICGKAGGYGEVDRLHPHELDYHDHIRRVTLERSVMCHTWCNAREHHERVIAPDEEAKDESFTT